MARRRLEINRNCEKKGLRLLVIINSLRTGGAEKQLCEILKIAKPLISSLDILLIDYEIDPSHQLSLNNVIIPSKSINKLTFKSIVNYWKEYRKDNKKLVTVIWSWGLRSDIIGCLLSVVFPFSRLITSIRSANNNYFDRNYLLNKIIYCKASLVVSNSKLGLSLFQQKFPKEAAKGFYLPNVIETHYPTDTSCKKNKILMLGNIRIHEKGYDIACNLANVLHELNPDISIDVYGKPYELEELKKHIGADKINYKGFTNDPYRILRNYQYFLLTSRHEGSPNGLLEAMSCGLVCFSTDIGDLSEEFEHESEIVIFPKDSQVEDMAVTVLSYIQNVDATTSIGNNASNAIRNRFGEKKALNNINCLFDKISSL